MRYIKDQHGELSLDFDDRPLSPAEEIFYESEAEGGNYDPGDISQRADVHDNGSLGIQVISGGTMHNTPLDKKLSLDAKSTGYQIMAPKGECPICGKKFTRKNLKKVYCSTKCRKVANYRKAKERRQEQEK